MLPLTHQIRHHHHHFHRRTTPCRASEYRCRRLVSTPAPVLLVAAEQKAIIFNFAWKCERSYSFHGRTESVSCNN